MKTLLTGTVLAASVVLPGCVQLPLDGPSGRDITSGAIVHAAADRHAIAYDYALVDLTPIVIDTLATVSTASIYSTFGVRDLGLPGQRVGAGDVLQVFVFESPTAGAFQTSEGSIRSDPYVALPPQTVNPSGTITVPYVGTVTVAGKTTRQIERDIETKLAPRAVEPHVVVSFLENNSSSVTVIGDGVGAANRFRLAGTGERILDIVSRAGGTRYPGYELFVTLHRGNRRVTVHFPRLVEDPRENIRVAPGDTIYVFRQQQKFVATGALGLTGQTTGITGQFPFDQEYLSLNEALGKAGGLQDSRADPAQVFIYRDEKRETLERMGIDLAKFHPELKWIPTVYRANFRDPSSFIFASKFLMRHRDVIYVGNSDATEIVKFLVYVRAITSTVAGVTEDVIITRDAFQGGRVLTTGK
jgi:polysaccharide export outer membrane protein